MASGRGRRASPVFSWDKTSRWGKSQLGALGGESTDRFCHWCGQRQGLVFVLTERLGYCWWWVVDVAMWPYCFGRWVWAACGRVYSWASASNWVSYGLSCRAVGPFLAG